MLLFLVFFTCNSDHHNQVNQDNKHVTTDHGRNSIDLNDKEVLIAAASSLQMPLDSICKLFYKKKGIKVVPIYGSSGKLYAQIMNKAPFDIFISADQLFPDSIFSHLKQLKHPKEFWEGELVFVINKSSSFYKFYEMKNSKLDDFSFFNNLVKEKIAIANPATAPYGRASISFFDRLFDLEIAHQSPNSQMRNLSKKGFVFGQNVQQVNTFLVTGVVEYGITSSFFSHQKIDHLICIHIPKEKYPAIKYDMIQLNSEPVVSQFYNFLTTEKTQEILSYFSQRNVN